MENSPNSKNPSINSNKLQEKVKLYNLKSDRFRYRDISQSAQKLMSEAKLKQRSDLKLNEWSKLKYSQDDWCQNTLKDPPVSPLQISYENYEELSQEEFESKYEKLNKPLIIKGATSNWKALNKWKIEVIK